MAEASACHPTDDANVLVRSSPLPTEAGLSVEVTPATGISVGLDGNKVASRAPFTRIDLEPGVHTLIVRGMGYLPMEMPVTLEAGKTLKVAVSLRARPLEPDAPPPPPPPPRRPAPERVSEGRPPPAAPPEIGTELPPGTSPVVLNLISQPEAPVVVDDEPSVGKTVSLHHTYGTLLVGSLKVRYAIVENRNPNESAGRGLELTLPDDAATWQRDTQDVSAGTVMRFMHGFTRLRRSGPEGEQSVILRWSDAPP